MSEPGEPGTAPAVIEAVGVHKSYRSGDRPLAVLRGLEFAAAEGEIVAIVGASGVGKSTLLHVLGGIDRPDAGLVFHRGRSLAALPPAERERLRNREIGFVFQFHYLLPEFDALENVMMPLLIAGAGRVPAEKGARAALEEMGILSRAHHRPGELSGGEQQRVAIARALVAGPDLILADEPTGNLDAETSAQVFAAFASRLAARRLTTVLVTHNLALAAAASRVLRMVEGRLVPEAKATSSGTNVPMR